MTGWGVGEGIDLLASLRACSWFPGSFEAEGVLGVGEGTECCLGRPFTPLQKAITTGIWLHPSSGTHEICWLRGRWLQTLQWLRFGWNMFSRVVAKADKALSWLSGESEPAMEVDPVGNDKHALWLSSPEL